MSVVITKCVWHNLGPFEHVEIDYSVPGLTVIEGQVLNRRGCESNGAGKSVLIEGIAFTLYDRCLRERFKGDDVVRRGSTGGAYGTVSFRNGSNKYVVTRYRGHPKFGNVVRVSCDGEDITKGTNPETNMLIESAFGLDYQSFTNVVAFGAREEIRSFFAAKDSDKKMILERLLGLEIYARAEEIARRYARKAAERCQEVENDLRRRSDDIDRCEQFLSAWALPEGFEEQLRLDQLRLVSLRRRLADFEMLKDSIGADMGTVQQEYEAACARHEQRLADIAHTRSELQARLSEVERDVGAANALRDASVNEANRIAKRKGSVCPTCKQTIFEAHVAGVQAEASRIKAECSHKVEMAALQRASVERALNDIPVPQPPSPPVALTLLEQARDTCLQSIAAFRTEIAALTATCTANAERVSAWNSRAKAMLEKVAQARAGVEALQVELKEARKQADVYQFWVEGFGNTGLKSLLIETEIPEINRRACAYAQRLLGDGAVVALSATRELKSKASVKEELTVNASIPGAAHNYYAASKGQKRRMDLAILLAFRDLCASRSSTVVGQLFADEVFDGLDKAGCEVVVEMLREAAKTAPVVLVTHDPRIRSAADRVVRVVHDGTTARLLAPSPSNATV